MSDPNTTFAQRAQLEVNTYIETHPEYNLDGVEQPGQGATNRVIFAQRGNETVVFKVFCELERKQRACFALEHWKDAGLVPVLIEDASPDMILIKYIPGIYLGESRIVDTVNIWHEAIQNTAIAISNLSNPQLNSDQEVYFQSHFYHPLGKFENYLNRILELGQRIHAQDPCFADPYWGENLLFIENLLPNMLSQPRVLYHQDVSNLHVANGKFIGFFDLEMCRIGCTAMQIGASLLMLDGDSEAWSWFRSGWEQSTARRMSDQDLEAALAAYYLLGWREISRYLSYDGTPGSGYSWASPADPDRYRKEFNTIMKMILQNP